MYVSRDKHTTFLEVYPAGQSTFDSTSGAEKMREGRGDAVFPRASR